MLYGKEKHVHITNNTREIVNHATNGCCGMRKIILSRHSKQQQSTAAINSDDCHTHTDRLYDCGN